MSNEEELGGCHAALFGSIFCMIIISISLSSPWYVIHNKLDKQTFGWTNYQEYYGYWYFDKLEEEDLVGPIAPSSMDDEYTTVYYDENEHEHVVEVNDNTRNILRISLYLSLLAILVSLLSFIYRKRILGYTVIMLFIIISFISWYSGIYYSTEWPNAYQEHGQFYSNIGEEVTFSGEKVHFDGDFRVIIEYGEGSGRRLATYSVPLISLTIIILTFWHYCIDNNNSIANYIKFKISKNNNSIMINPWLLILTGIITLISFMYIGKNTKSACLFLPTLAITIIFGYSHYIKEQFKHENTKVVSSQKTTLIDTNRRYGVAQDEEILEELYEIEEPDSPNQKENDILPTKKYKPWTKPMNIVCLQLYLYNSKFNQGTGRPHITLKYTNEEIRIKFDNRTVGGLNTQVQGYAQHDPNPGAIKKNKSSKGREEVWNEYHDMEPDDLTDMANDFLDGFP